MSLQEFRDQGTVLFPDVVGRFHPRIPAGPSDHISQLPIGSQLEEVQSVALIPLPRSLGRQAVGDLRRDQGYVPGPEAGDRQLDRPFQGRFLEGVPRGYPLNRRESSTRKQK
jgi:hypothetical protein